MEKIKEMEEYRKYTSKMEIDTALHTLKGIVHGISSDGKISNDEVNELSNWCTLHNHLIKTHPFDELIPMIRDACSDGIISDEESHDIFWVCNNFQGSSRYYDRTTNSLQFLFGLLHGVLADGKLSDDEVYKLREWLSFNSDLEGHYPFDELESLIGSVLMDGAITEDERNLLIAFIGEFIDTSMSYNLNEEDIKTLQSKYSIGGICTICQEIDFESSTFCFTGKSLSASRNEIANIVTAHGGTYIDRVTKNTDYLIVGNAGNPCWAYSCYGRKVEQAVDLRKSGGKIKIINEIDFWDILEDL